MARGSRTKGLHTQGIAAAIRARRAELNVTWGSVADETEIKRNLLSQIVNGQAAIDVDQLGAIATALDTTMSQLARDAERIQGHSAIEAAEEMG